VKTEGYYLSLEAILSMALLGILLASPLPEAMPGLENLHLFKKENDLLLLWARQFDSVNERVLREDFEFAFPGKSGEITLDGKKLAVGKKGRESVSSEAVFFDRHMQAHKIRLVVFKKH